MLGISHNPEFTLKMASYLTVGELVHALFGVGYQSQVGHLVTVVHLPELKKRPSATEWKFISTSKIVLSKDALADCRLQMQSVLLLVYWVSETE